MNFIYNWLFPAAWATFAIYWILSSGWVSKTERPEPRTPRIIRLTLSSLAFVLIASPRFRTGPLGWRLLPQNKTTFFAGALLLWAGLGFAVWARLHLGRFWSSSVSLKEGHQLIREGPYRLVRHPIYTGITTAVAGTAVALGEVRGLIAVALLAAVYFYKSRREEGLLLTEFGDEYFQYQKQVKALVPFVL